MYELDHQDRMAHVHGLCADLLSGAAGAGRLMAEGYWTEADQARNAQQRRMLRENALLAETTTLPQARLEQLAAQGVILSVMTFEDHMHPTVHWIEPEEFGAAFEELTNGDKLMADTRFEAAFTPAGDGYPPFINARQGDRPGTVTITVRSAPSVGHPDAHGGDNGVICGPTAQITMDIQDFDQWVADLGRLRQSLG